jgi:antitoxin component YwqK of YwqJK toxin-antitoxin module
MQDLIKINNGYIKSSSILHNKINGVCIDYTINLKIIKKQFYFNGKITGTSYEYYPYINNNDMKIKIKILYFNNIEYGLYNEYYINKFLKTQYFIKNGAIINFKNFQKK